MLDSAGLAAGFAVAPVAEVALEESVELGVTELVVPRESLR
ncbi:MAG: hypothetical protein NWS06_00495 [Candidatus Nanopelagicales bacterium]|nr:hypothetical protein [Candidatus Nanopelagicales bacterium]MDP4666486.1 hypothetical protein [Candidatus Nanopelagicales bacterium]MDP4896075.1 hypothetical protein [Candidatus Nanopelagicales bacterium]MDP5050261.1 hypothetical protein [Candidatus Nanopelagicales bacterium]